MAKRSLWLLLAVGLGLLLGYAWTRRAAPPPVTSAPAPAGPRPEVAIQDQKTIDFSSGKPVVKDTSKDKAIMDAAAKEMAEATKDITFEPTPPPSPKK